MREILLLLCIVIFLFGICFLSVFLREWSSALGEDSYDFVFVFFYSSLAPFIFSLNGPHLLASAVDLFLLIEPESWKGRTLETQLVLAAVLRPSILLDSFSMK